MFQIHGSSHFLSSTIFQWLWSRHIIKHILALLSVLCCLAERYGNEEIYTSAGSTVVAVNPFRNISGLYTLEKILAYHRQKEVSLLFMVDSLDCKFWR